MELRCPSLSYVLDMTWAEFCIRLHGFHRLDKREWEKHRLGAYWNYVNTFAYSKKKPLSIDRFFPLEIKKKPILTEKQEEAIKKAVNEYNLKKNKSV